jgi:serine/threonine protein kinase
MVGRLLGQYRIGEKLGAGAMGDVYRAEDTRLGRDVAIKVLPDALANDPDRLQRLAREARVLAFLNHPNIAAIYALEEIEISMPWCSNWFPVRT